MRKKGEVAKTRRIVVSPESGQRDSENPEQPQRSPSELSDFSKRMDLEIDFINRRYSHIIQERQYQATPAAHGINSEKDSVEERYTNPVGNLQYGKEMGGVRLKDTAYRNTGLQRKQTSTPQLKNSIEDRDMTEERERRQSVSNKEMDFDNTDDRRENASGDVFGFHIPIEQEINSGKLSEEKVLKTTTLIDAVPMRDKIPPEFQKELVNQENRVGEEIDRATMIPEIRQTIIDSQCLHSKFSPCSGNDPKPRTEASFEEWKYEVECIRKEKEHTNTTIVQAVRKSLRGRDKRFILTPGIPDKIEDIMDKPENDFGNVSSGQTIIKEFYIAAQKETETVNE